jgi:hypothetical protein
MALPPMTEIEKETERGTENVKLNARNVIKNVNKKKWKTTDGVDLIRVETIEEDHLHETVLEDAHRLVIDVIATETGVIEITHQDDRDPRRDEDRLIEEEMALLQAADALDQGKLLIFFYNYFYNSIFNNQLNVG